MLQILHKPARNFEVQRIYVASRIAGESQGAFRFGGAIQRRSHKQWSFSMVRDCEELMDGDQRLEWCGGKGKSPEGASRKLLILW